MMFEASAECCSAKTCEFSNFPNCNILPQPQAACVNHPNMELISGIDKQQFLIFSSYLFQNHIEFLADTKLHVHGVLKALLMSKLVRNRLWQDIQSFLNGPSPVSFLLFWNNITE